MATQQREARSNDPPAHGVSPTSLGDAPWRAFTTSMAEPGSPSAYAQSVVIVGLCTLLAWQLAPHFRPSNLLMIYLVGTVVAAMNLGRGPAIVAALASV